MIKEFNLNYEVEKFLEELLEGKKLVHGGLIGPVIDRVEVPKLRIDLYCQGINILRIPNTEGETDQNVVIGVIEDE